MKHIYFSFFLFISALSAAAQPGKSAKSPVEYTVFKKLQPGEKAIPLYSCMWLNEKGEFVKLVIQQTGGKYSVIANGVRKDNLELQQVNTRNAADCDKYDPHRQTKATQYTGSKLTKYNANGSKTIQSGGKTYGPYDDILYMQEKGERFVAAVKVISNGKVEFWYIDSEGRKKLLDTQPIQLITNSTLTKAAVVMRPAGTLPTDIINTWPKDKQYDYLDSISRKEERIWFSHDSTRTLARKYRRLEYDISGRHFLAVYPDHFMIDGVRVNKNISGAGTRLFAGNDPRHWVYAYQIYIGFSDGSAYQNVINPFMTTENGKDYLNWFVVESNSSGDIIKWAKKEL